MFPYLSLNDIDLTEKTVILRVDFNSPVDSSEGAVRLKNTKRIDDHIHNTIIPLLSQDHPPKNIVLLSHQGRRGRPDCTTLRPHFEHCRAKLQDDQIKVFYVWEELTDEEVLGLGESAVVCDEVVDRILRLRERTVLLLENVRFAERDTEDSAGPEDFAANPLIGMLRKVSNSVVALDGFSVAHRAQASVVGLACLGPLYAGPIVVREIKQLSGALEKPQPPMVLVVGGAKADDSLDSIEHFLQNGKAHLVLTGGLVGLLFLAAKNVRLDSATMENIHRSTSNFEQALERAKALLSSHAPGKLRCPVDVAFGPVDGLERDRVTIGLDEMEGRDLPHAIGDIGIETIADYNSAIARAKTIVMNGPMGRYESQCFARGTGEILRYIAFVSHDRNAHALIGGGDTGAALGTVARDTADQVLECSSGKAFLQVLASGNVDSLDGIRALARRRNN